MGALGSTISALSRWRRAALLPPSGGPDGVLKIDAKFGANPGQILMYTYVPANLPRNAPLVVVLHGCLQTAEGYAVGAGWTALAERRGFALLCPEQTQFNNPNRCWNWFLPGDTLRGKGEASSIRHMIANMLRSGRYDRKRVFITGLSAGGAMTSAMLAAYPEVFSGGAIVAGLPYGAASNVQQALAAMRVAAPAEPAIWGQLVRRASSYKGPWPRVSIWHGDADETVAVANADAIAAQWAYVHGFPAEGFEVDDLSGNERRRWLDKDGQVAIERINLKGVAHGAPITALGDDSYGVVGPYLLETGISSSRNILDFWGIPSPDAAARPFAVQPLAAAPAPERRGMVSRMKQAVGAMVGRKLS